MPIFHAIVLGLVQGLSEFLPISSSGHLLLVPWLCGWDDFDSSSVEKAFDVALHLGTLVAAIFYFRKDLAVYVRDGLRLVFSRGRTATPEGRLAWLLLLSTIPAAAAGALLESWIDDTLGTPVIIGISLIVFGLLLAWADRSTGQRKVEEFGVRDAVIVGAAQALALNPGTSRSGITMTAARFRNFDRDAAVRLSFLMAIPVTAGAIVFKLTKLVSDGIPEGLLVPMIVGIVTSGIAGWLAIWGTLKLVRTRSLMPFVIYRISVGVIILIALALGVSPR
jgi:undecaprenyl-diphosphatase